MLTGAVLNPPKPKAAVLFAAAAPISRLAVAKVGEAVQDEPSYTSVAVD